MRYKTRQDWQGSQQKRVLVFGMSGLGKTYVSDLLRDSGDWYHYSVDYRIGTRYMGEYIVDNFKREAMKNPFLADLLRSDSIKIKSNIAFENLAPLSTYLGKPGDPRQGGLPIAEYRRRQAQHHRAETDALLDTPYFIQRAGDLYGYPHFICDTGGSICEVVDATNPEDPLMTTLAAHCQMVWIKGSEDHTQALIRRFDKTPKPMCYQAAFLEESWAAYLPERGVGPDKVNPDDFIRWTFARALHNRIPKYAAMAEWGITVSAEDVSQIKTVHDFNDLIGQAIDNHAKGR